LKVASEVAVAEVAEVAVGVAQLQVAEDFSFSFHPYRLVVLREMVERAL
jgi:hypothetical protein